MTSGLHSCKPGNEPTVGETKNFTIEQRIGKSGKPWTKIKADREGQPYRVVKATKTDFTDDHGNVSFNIEIEPQNGAPQAQVAPQRAASNAVGGDDARHHTMRAANLLLLCHNAAKAVLGETCNPEDARSLFIYLSRAGYVQQMPDKPMSAQSESPEPDDAPELDEEEQF